MSENVSFSKSSQFIHDGHKVSVYDSTAIVTATQNSSDVTNRYGRGVFLHFDHSLGSTLPSTQTPTVTVKLQAKSPSGDYYDITDAAFAARSTAGDAVLTVYPGAVASTNSVANNVIPQTWRAVFTHASTGTHTYKLTGYYIP